MAPILIECPTTGVLVPVGIDTDSLDELDTEGHVVLVCPNCGRDHEWTAEDAVLGAAASDGTTIPSQARRPPA